MNNIGHAPAYSCKCKQTGVELNFCDVAETKKTLRIYFRSAQSIQKQVDLFDHQFPDIGLIIHLQLQEINAVGKRLI